MVANGEPLATIVKMIGEKYQSTKWEGQWLNSVNDDDNAYA